MADMSITYLADVVAGIKCCTGCERWWPSTTEYFRAGGAGKPGGYRLTTYCKGCLRALDVAWCASHKEHCTIRRREYARKTADKNRERINRTARKNYSRNNYLARKRAYRKRRPDVHRAISARQRAKRVATPEGRINERMSAGMRGRLRKDAQERGSPNKGGRSWQQIIGYTTAELRAHLERQFLPRMGWHNIGKWEIDHIIPLASFRFISLDDPEFKAAWALTNLRPLWRWRNRSKSDTRETLL